MTNARQVAKSLKSQLKRKQFQAVFLKGVNRGASISYAQSRMDKVLPYDISGTDGEHCGTFMVRVLKAGGGAPNAAADAISLGDVRGMFGLGKTPNKLAPMLADDSDETAVTV